MPSEILILFLSKTDLLTSVFKGETCMKKGGFQNLILMIFILEYNYSWQDK